MFDFRGLNYRTGEELATYVERLKEHWVLRIITL
jgi:hypothetical protein